jgi:hypothetical protein
MIRMPRRSVTRFFIPLVDVMILLFSMFLLMPIVQKAGQGSAADPEQALAELRADKEALQRELQRRTQQLQDLQQLYKPQADVRKLLDELKRLREEKIKVLQQRLAIRVLEIDPRTGDLVVYEDGQPPRRRVIDSKEAAEALIRRQQKEVAPRELYYLFLFPRVDSAYPEERQFETYKTWFRDVPHGIDRPGLPAK